MGFTIRGGISAAPGTDCQSELLCFKFIRFASSCYSDKPLSRPRQSEVTFKPSVENQDFRRLCENKTLFAGRYISSINTFFSGHLFPTERCYASSRQLIRGFPFRECTG